MNSLAKLKGVADALQPTRVGAVLDQGSVPQPQVDFSLVLLREVRSDCAASGLHLAVDQVDRMSSHLASRPVSWREFVQLNSELYLRIEDELKRRAFYQITPDKAAFYEDGGLLGNAVTSRFPDIDHDLREAFKCYACERYDASVYHLMRAMEHVLRALAGTIGVPYAPSWDGYLKAISLWLGKVNRSDPDQRKKEAFLSEAAVLLNSIKIAWRNNVMHVSSRYSEDQAKQILDSVVAFVKSIAANWRD